MYICCTLNSASSCRLHAMPNVARDGMEKLGQKLGGKGFIVMVITMIYIIVDCSGSLSSNSGLVQMHCTPFYEVRVY